MLAAQQGRLKNKTPDELDALLSACMQYCALNPHSRVFDPTIDLLRDEIKRREDQKERIEAGNRHDAAILETKNVHSAVQRLGKPHWSLTPGFVVILLTMIFAAIAAWPVIREWLPASQPASKAASSPQLQSNSPPAQPAIQQTSPIASGVTPSTNNP